MLLHTSELHAAVTHLAVVAVLVYALLLLLRRTRWTSPTARATEPWVLGGALIGMAAAGVTGLIVAARRRRSCAAAPIASGRRTSGSGSRWR